MFTIGSYDFTQGFIGFIVGILFAGIIAYIFISLFIRFFTNRRQRGYHHPDLYGGQYPPEVPGGGIGCMPVIFVLLLAGIGFTKIQQSGFFKTNKEADVTETSPKPSVKTDTADEVAPAAIEKEAKNKELYTAPADDAQAETSRNNGGSFFIQVCFLNNKDKVDETCQDFINKGFSAASMPKNLGTAVFIGPYASWDKANSVRQKYGFTGAIESY